MDEKISIEELIEHLTEALKTIRIESSIEDRHIDSLDDIYKIANTAYELCRRYERENK